MCPECQEADTYRAPVAIRHLGLPRGYLICRNKMCKRTFMVEMHGSVMMPMKVEDDVSDEHAARYGDEWHQT